MWPSGTYCPVELSKQVQARETSYRKRPLYHFICVWSAQPGLVLFSSLSIVCVRVCVTLGECSVLVVPSHPSHPGQALGQRACHSLATICTAFVPNSQRISASSLSVTAGSPSLYFMLQRGLFPGRCSGDVCSW